MNQDVLAPLAVFADQISRGENLRVFMAWHRDVACNDSQVERLFLHQADADKWLADHARRLSETALPADDRAAWHNYFKRDHDRDGGVMPVEIAPCAVELD